MSGLIDLKEAAKMIIGPVLDSYVKKLMETKPSDIEDASQAESIFWLAISEYSLDRVKGKIQ